LDRGKDEGAPEKLHKRAWVFGRAMPYKRSAGHLDGNDYSDMTKAARWEN
jgi:hypothetical protein